MTVVAGLDPRDGHTPGPGVAEMTRLSGVEPVVGHVKAEHRMDRNYLKGRKGDRANAVLAAGYDFSLLPRRPEVLLRAIFQAPVTQPGRPA